MRKIIFAVCSIAVILITGCKAVYPADRGYSPVPKDVENQIVYTRTTKFWPFFGSYSVGEYLEITYEKVSYNSAGQLVFEVGIRNHGPVSWTNWFVPAPAIISLQLRCDFFEGAREASPVIDSTNTQEIIIERGKTAVCRFVCPKKGAKSCQLILTGFNE